MTAEKPTNKGRFVAGKSGNPRGRPLGSRNARSLFLESILDEDSETIIRTVVELAKNKNLHALEMCVNRLMPPRKDRAVFFQLPPIRNLSDISSAMSSVITAVSEGELTPPEGETISRILEQHANVTACQDLERRVEKLERPRSGKNEVRIVRSYK